MIGGCCRNRTDLLGFAIRCITNLPSSLNGAGGGTRTRNFWVEAKNVANYTTHAILGADNEIRTRLSGLASHGTTTIPYPQLSFSEPMKVETCPSRQYYKHILYPLHRRKQIT